MGSISRTTRSRHACRSATLRALRLSAGGAAAPAVVAGPVAAGVDDGNGPYLRPATKTVHRTQIHASAESHQGELPAAPPPPPPPPLLRCALAGTPGPRSSCRRSASQALDPATALMLRAVRGFTRVRYPVASGGGSTRNASSSLKAEHRQLVRLSMCFRAVRLSLVRRYPLRSNFIPQCRQAPLPIFRCPGNAFTLRSGLP